MTWHGTAQHNGNAHTYRQMHDQADVRVRVRVSAPAPACGPRIMIMTQVLNHLYMTTLLLCYYF